MLDKTTITFDKYRINDEISILTNCVMDDFDIIRERQVYICSERTRDMFLCYADHLPEPFTDAIIEAVQREFVPWYEKEILPQDCAVREENSGLKSFWKSFARCFASHS